MGRGGSKAIKTVTPSGVVVTRQAAKTKAKHINRCNYIDSMTEEYLAVISQKNDPAARKFSWFSKQLLYAADDPSKAALRSYARLQFLTEYASMPAAPEAETFRQEILRSLRDEILAAGVDKKYFGPTVEKMLAQKPFGEELSRVAVRITAEELLSLNKGREKSPAEKKAITDLLEITEERATDLEENKRTLNRATTLLLARFDKSPASKRITEQVLLENKNFKRAFGISATGHVISSPTVVVLEDEAYQNIAGDTSYDPVYKQLFFHKDTDLKGEGYHRPVATRLLEYYAPEATGLDGYIRKGSQELALEQLGFQKLRKPLLQEQITRSLVISAGIDNRDLLKTEDRFRYICSGLQLDSAGSKKLVKVIEVINSAARENTFSYEQIDSSIQGQIQAIRAEAPMIKA